MKKIALWEAKHPKTVVLIAVLLLIPSLIGFLCTRVNYDVMSYLPDNLASVQGEKVLDETFNNAGMSILVIEDMPSKYTAALKDEISKLEGVSAVFWVDDLADISIPSDIIPDALKDIFYSKTGEQTMMLVQYNSSGSSDETLETIKQIKGLINEKTFISGLTAIVEDTKEICDTQAPIYIAVAVVLALIIMSLLMDSWILPFVVLATIGMAILYNMGTNIFLGEISFITQSIAAILQLGVTIDYSIFLIDRYHEEKLRYATREEAMANAVVKSITALMGSSLTTIFGFLALCFMRLKLGFDIGFVMAKGVVLGIVSVIFVLPAMLLLFEEYIDKYRHKSLMPEFPKLNNFIFKHRKVLAIIFVVLLVPAYFVQSKATPYYSMDKALNETFISVQGLEKLKADFDMATTHFIIFDDSLPSGEIIQMENEIKSLDGIATVLAYNSIVGPAIPDDIIPDDILSICKADGLQLMMVNSKYATATDELNAQVDELNTIVHKYDPNAYVTGEGAISKDLIEVTDTDFTVTSIISIAAIFILIALSLKSISLPILLVLSIELAIWLNLATSVLLGSSMSFVDSTVINCVQLGATVDYAILLTTRFREELRLGHSKHDSIINAVSAAEKSILQSASVFFAATFGVYCICDIAIIKGICALLARGSVISAFVIIFLLTPLLYICEKPISKTTLNWRTKSKKDQLKEAENNV